MQIQLFKLFKNCSINILKKSSLRFLEPKIIFLVPQNVTVGSPGPMDPLMNEDIKLPCGFVHSEFV